MPPLSVFGTDVSIRTNHYSLNDLHRAAGGEAKHQPSRFLRNEQTRDLIAEIGKYPDLGISPIEIIRGAKGGTYVCKELVYAYAMWISPKFNLAVIRAFDSYITDQLANASNMVQPETVAAAPAAHPLSFPRCPGRAYKAETLSYVGRDRDGSMNWWCFDHAGGGSNWAGPGSRAQGEAFWHETQHLARHNAKEAQQAITWALMHIMGGSVDGIGIKYCELAYCEGVAEAAIRGILSTTAPATKQLTGAKA